MKYTFEDWNSGKFTIEGTYHMPVNNVNPEIIYWHQIEEGEKQKIHNEQESIFLEFCEREYKLILNEFNQHYEKSDFKEMLVSKEIHKLKEILFNETNFSFPLEDYKWGKIDPLSYDNEIVIRHIRKYFSKCYIDGHTENYNFVNSPNSPNCIDFDKFDFTPEVQGEVLYRFYKYLIELTDEKIIFDKQYWNLKTYQLFLHLSEKFVHKKIITKYTVIFHFLNDLFKVKANGYFFLMSYQNYIEFIQKNINPAFKSNEGKAPKMNKPFNYDEEYKENLTRLEEDFKASYIRETLSSNYQ